MALSFESDDLEDSLDSLFGSVSPSSNKKQQLRSSVAEEDKAREARLYKQKQSGGEDVDSLLSELRGARGGSMAKRAQNVFNSPQETSVSSTSKPRGRRRKDDGVSKSKDAADFFEESARSKERSRRLGGAAATWLDSSPTTSPTNTTAKKMSPKSAGDSSYEENGSHSYPLSSKYEASAVFVVMCVRFFVSFVLR